MIPAVSINALSNSLPARPALATRELRVLQVFHGLGVGGAETWLMSLLKYFQELNKYGEQSVQFDVLLTGGEKAVFDDEAEAFGARLFYLPFTRRTLPNFIKEFRTILRNGRYDAIHDHQDYIAGLHFLMGAGLLPGIRVAHVHNPIFRQTNYARGIVRRSVRESGKRLIRALATHVMGTSREILRDYGFTPKNFPRLMMGAAHCGFDVSAYDCDQNSAHDQLSEEFGLPPSAKIILFVGRLEGESVIHFGRRMTHKNPEFALEVARECISLDSNVHIVMAGDGETKRQELERQAYVWGIQDKVRFVGVRHDVPRLMAGSDLLLFPSLAEGLGMVVVEAQAAGLRVLASDSTPRESMVIPESISFESLAESPSYWATKCLEILELSRLNASDCNLAVRQSDFSIQNSANWLLRIYGAQVR